MKGKLDKRIFPIFILIFLTTGSAHAQSISATLDSMLNATLDSVHNDMAKIALESNMSEYHFYRLFKSVFGKSPHKYIIGKRLMYGNDLLKSGCGNVTEVAEISGFPDVFSFSKSYKKHFGYCPSESKELL